MTTAQRTQRPMTPNEYRYWWDRASDEDIIEAQHPDEYEAEYRASQAQQRQPEAARPAFRGGNAPRSSQRAPAQGVREQPYVQPKAKASPLVGVFALLIGLPFWFEAARFTRDGWILAINWLCNRLSIPWEVPTLDWRVALGAALVLGVAYSRIEARPPLLPPKNWRKEGLTLRAWRVDRTWQVWAVWLFLIVTDIGSTYVGARNRGQSADELRILRDIATSGAALVGYAILLTFAPDGLIRYGWRVFWRK